MRAIWKGSISFGLVNVPISLYPATTRKELSFHLLRKSDLSPIKYKRVAEADGKEVSWEQIVKGYEYEKGKFVVITDEDFERADIEATQTIEVLEFVQLKQIDPIFFDQPYYLEPQRQGAKAYALLREALKKMEMVGIAKVVLKTRQHLASIKPEQNALVLELMHFAEELVSPTALQIPGDISLASRELEMASQLINRLSNPWEPTKYADEYQHKLLDLIQKKIASGGRMPAGNAPSKRSPTKVIDLVSVLQQSLEKAGRGGVAKKSARAHRPKRALKKAA
ncbi:MAG TPA: Ku protein [Verrucomicrobiae bacterium]|nr:Ku protein [Verrucomicrobiae bacterium]